MNDPFCRAELTGPYNRRALTESDLTQAVDDAAMFAGQSAASAETAQAAALEAASVVAGVTGSADTAIAAAEAAAISEQDAAAHRTEAAGYAQQTEDDADRAGTSAFNAAASAAAAQSSEDDAEESATAAQASRVGAEAARGGAETAQTGAQGAQTAAEAAANLALAGQFLGTQVSNSGVDVNTLGPGVWRFNTAAATASQNTPVNAAGVLTVTTPTGSATQLLQRYEPYLTAISSRVFYERMVASGGGVWRTYSAQRVDNPTDQPGVGIYTWDEMNAREQALMPVGNALGSVDLDAVTLPGVYSQTSSAIGTPARHYPTSGSVAGVLEVLPVGNAQGGVSMIQRFTPTNGTGGGAQGISIRRRMVSTGAWDPWYFVPSQTVDQTAGRVITTWDDANNRPQMIYGDTGWRDISSLFINGWTGAAYLRRNAGIVSVKLEGVDPSARTATNVLTLPPGFRGGVGSLDRFLLFNAPINAAVSTLVRAQATTATIDSVSPTNAGILYGSGSWPTNDAWPASLPGAAVGSIPNL